MGLTLNRSSFEFSLELWWKRRDNDLTDFLVGYKFALMDCGLSHTEEYDDICFLLEFVSPTFRDFPERIKQ